MPPIFIRPLALAAALAAMPFAFARAQAPESAVAGYNEVFSFGDSLSDAGNDWVATAHAEPVSPPYSMGRFTNGNVWVQYLAKALGLKRPAPSLLGGRDFAFGGAETGATAVHTLSQLDLPAQLAEFTLSYPRAPARALYTLSIGGNDLFAALTGGGAGQVAVAQAVANETAFVSALVAQGARHILVMNVPDLGFVPSIWSQGAVAVKAGRTIAAAYDAALATALAGVATKTGASIQVLNAYALMDQAVMDHRPFGFTDVHTACWTGTYTSATSGTVCAPTVWGQDKHLFWDGVHPTTHGHALLAAQAMTQLP